MSDTTPAGQDAGDTDSTDAPVDQVDIGGSATPLGDESTGGQAARDALGIDPSDARYATGEVPDNSTGESTHADVVGDEG